MRTISIKGVNYAFDSVRDTSNADVQAILAGCHAQAEFRPLCLCSGQGVPLQVRNLQGVYHLARMPEQGLSHAPDCEFYGESEHSHGQSSGEKLLLNFSLSLSQNYADGHISLAGLLNQLWLRANLHRWISSNKPRSWKTVAKQLHKGATGLKLNGIPISKLLWIMPKMDESNLNQMRDGCFNFVKSCSSNRHYALLIAPIGTCDYQEATKSNCLRFRVMDNLPTYIKYKKFPFRTQTLKEHGEYPFPVAIILAKVLDGKHYLLAEDIAMLWMTPSYLPCTTKDRVKPLTDVMRNAEYLQVPLNKYSGAISSDIALIKKNGQFTAMRSNEPALTLPWIPNEKK